MKQQNEKTEISTLTALNEYLKQLNSSVRIGPEDFDPDEPTTAQLDKAVAASKKVVNGKVTKGELVGDLKTQLAQKPPPAKDPLQARREAAKRVPVYDGEYYGGTAAEPHVHVYGSEFHLKLGAERVNIYVDNKLRQGALTEARTKLSTHALKNVLNPAIDRALLDCKLELDTY
jgi:hypothetical protein